MTEDQSSLTDADTWLDHYGRLRIPGPGHPSEWLGTPLAVAGLVAWLWSLPVPDAFQNIGYVLNWGTVFLMATVVYYFILSISLAFGALPLITAIVLACTWLDRSGLPIGTLGIGVFVIALAWQIAASSERAERLAVFERLQHLMIGPLWLLAAVYRRANIPY